MRMKPVPPKRAGHVLVRIRAAGVNPVDAKFVAGDKFPECCMPFWKRKFTGYTAGFDFAGDVLDAPKTSGFKKGDAIFGTSYQYPPQSFFCSRYTGTFQPFASVPADQCASKPESLSFAEAASLPLVGLTCLQAFEQHGLSEGQRLLVVGASGGVGHIAVQLASKMGIHVTGVCSTPNVDMVKSLGASDVVDYRAGDAIEGLKALVAKHGMFDMVFDTVSSADSRDKAAAYERRIRTSDVPLVKTAQNSPDEEVDGHNYVVFGGTLWQFSAAAVQRFCCGLNCHARGFALFWINMQHGQRYLKKLKEFCDERGVKPQVKEDCILPFNETGAQRAFRSLNPPPGEGRKVAGKIVLDLNAGDGDGIDDKFDFLFSEDGKKNK